MNSYEVDDVKFYKIFKQMHSNIQKLTNYVIKRYGMDKDEAEAILLKSLASAINRYDSSKNCTFKTFFNTHALCFIKNEYIRIQKYKNEIPLIMKTEDKEIEKDWYLKYSANFDKILTIKDKVKMLKLIYPELRKFIDFIIKGYSPKDALRLEKLSDNIINEIDKRNESVLQYLSDQIPTNQYKKLRSKYGNNNAKIVQVYFKGQLLNEQVTFIRLKKLKQVVKLLSKKTNKMLHVVYKNNMFKIKKTVNVVVNKNEMTSKELRRMLKRGVMINILNKEVL